MDISVFTAYACSVAQFISLSSDYLDAIRNDAAAGMPADALQRCSDLKKSLLDQSTSLRFASAADSTILSSEDEICLRLSKNCQSLLSELFTHLEILGPKDPTKKQVNGVVGNGTHWPKLLDSIRHDVNDGLASCLWKSISQTIRELGAKNSRLEANRTSEIKNLASEIDECFQHIGRKEAGDAQLLQAWRKVDNAMETVVDYNAEQTILRTLQFWTMDHRKALIPKEHENTFQWILVQEPSNDPTQPVANFFDWLACDESLYWISGKPGSGKSTLMKFIAGSPKTMDRLKEWAGDDALITAAFYFWSSAKDPLQKSDTGLLRSILFQILRQCPDLIQSAYPEQWQDRASGASIRQFARTEPSISDLLAAYDRVSMLLPKTGVKFCFFIDGLDEYDGEPADVIRLIESLGKTHNLKTCISSRQWHEFEDMFGGDNPWKLYVHEFTKGDMKLYVDNLLNKDTKFTSMKNGGDANTTNALIDSIADKAEGVFLWVFLVVRTLLDGVTDANGISDLQEKLDTAPSDLDAYFDEMFLHVEEQMRAKTSTVFRIALNAEQKLPLMCYSFIRDSLEKDIADIKQQPLIAEEAGRRLQDAEQWLATYSQGLLVANNLANASPDTTDVSESQWLFGHHVDFIHRTVGDFLRTAHMARRLEQWAAPAMSIDEEICKACLATIRVTSPTVSMFNDPAHAPGILHVFMSHTMLLQTQERVHFLDKCLDALRKHSQDLEGIHAMLLGPGNYWAYQASFNFGVLFYCVSYGLWQYVAKKLDSGGMEFAESQSGLLTGCLSWNPRVRSGKVALTIATIEVLLRRGLDPNLRWGDSGISFWQQLLVSAYSRYLKGMLTQVDCDAVRCTIEHGADMSASIEIMSARKMGNITAAEIVEKLLPKDQVIGIRDN